jgi:hypothetical protein
VAAASEPSREAAASEPPHEAAAIVLRHEAALTEAEVLVPAAVAEVAAVDAAAADVVGGDFERRIGQWLVIPPF